MKRDAALIHLALALVFLFGAAFSCGQNNNNRRSSTYTPDQNTATRGPDTSARSSSGLPDMTGGWLVVSQTTRGEREDPSQPSFGCIAFRNGTWNYGHNGGSAEGGTYRLSGNRLVMTGDDGVVAYDFRLSSRSGSDLWLEYGDQAMHLRFLSSTGCGR